MSESCENCHYFLPDKMNVKEGTCRCNPPQVLSVGANKNPLGQIVPLTFTAFPRMHLSGWCGRWLKAVGSVAASR